MPGTSPSLSESQLLSLDTTRVCLVDATAHDYQLRRILKAHLAADTAEPNLLVIDELTLAYGAVRADVATIGARLEGFEIKAANDTLARLPRQVQAYDETFERCWAVTVQSHAAKVNALLPSWWGLLVTDDAGTALEVRRAARDNPMVSAAQLARLLWREEALELLAQRNLLTGYKTKPKIALFARIANHLSVQEVAAYVRQALRNRGDWRTELPKPTRS